MAAAEDHLTEYAFKQVERCELIVPGTPMGKGRPRFSTKTGHAFTPKTTKLAESVVIEAWMNAGCPRLPDGPIGIDIFAYFDRPAGHFKKDGSLSASGRRWPSPTKKPDWDNVAKLIGDALNKRAYRDDAQIVEVAMSKLWTATGQAEHLALRLWSVPTLGMAQSPDSEGGAL